MQNPARTICATQGPDQHRAARGALGQPDLRIYDCTTYLEPTPAGSEDPYIAVPGARTFEEAHIPGADFLDLQGEFSDPTTRLRFMMPPTRSWRPPSAATASAGLPRRALQHRQHDVVDALLVDAASRWASIGAAVLDGGFDKWKAEGRPIESGPPRAIRRRPSRQCRDRACSSARRRCRPRLGKPRHRDRQRARAAVPQGPGAQPLRPARAGARQRQRVGGDAGRSRDQGLHLARRRRREVRGAGRDQGQAGRSAIAAAASRPPSTCSCCTSSATTISPSTMAPWASGRRTTSLPIETG